jgi:hypothetical protein
MKNQIPGNLRFRSLFLALIVAILPFAVDAQPPSNAPVASGSSSDGTLVSSDFEIPNMLPLSEAVNLLRKQHPEANFVLAAGIENIEVGNLKLLNASLEDKLEAIRIASGFKFGWEIRGFSPGQMVINPGTGMPSAAPKPARPMYVLSSSEPEKRHNLQVEAFNVNEYLNSFDVRLVSSSNRADLELFRKQKILDLKAMVEETLDQYIQAIKEASGNGAETIHSPSIKFHEGANLIVVIGEPDAVAVAAKVICALPGVQHSTSSSAFDAQNNFQQRLNSIMNGTQFNPYQAQTDQEANKRFSNMPGLGFVPAPPMAPPAPVTGENQQPPNINRTVPMPPAVPPAPESGGNQ